MGVPDVSFQRARTGIRHPPKTEAAASSQKQLSKDCENVVGYWLTKHRLEPYINVNKPNHESHTSPQEVGCPFTPPHSVGTGRWERNTDAAT